MYRTLADVLGGGSEGYTHLTDEDRRVIRDILLDTKSEFVRYCDLPLKNPVPSDFFEKYWNLSGSFWRQEVSIISCGSQKPCKTNICKDD